MAATTRKPKTPEPEPARLVVDGKEYPLVDLEDLDLNEIELVEDAFGMPAEDIDWRRAKAMRWLLFLSMRRAGERVDFEDLGTVKVSAISTVEGAETPTDGA